VKVADCLNVGKNASTDHERQHVYRNEKRCADREGYEHSYGNFSVSVKLNLNHGHLESNEILNFNQLFHFYFMISVESLLAQLNCETSTMEFNSLSPNSIFFSFVLVCFVKRNTFR
jgi:hypothetical protein